MTERGSNIRGLTQLKERLIGSFFFACAMLSIVTTAGIVGVLIFDAADFFSQSSFWAFITGTRWSPLIRPVEFGVLPLLSGTLVFTFLTALVAVPLGVLAAIYLSEYATQRARSIIKPGLEVLAGIPTVVYGYFALVYITPFLRNTILPDMGAFNVLSASIVVGIMIIPTIASISEDSMRSVPDSLRQAGYGLGVTKFQVSTRIVVPAAVSGIVSSFILGISRAIGETMAVTIAAGNYPRLIQVWDLPGAVLDPVQTMTAAMVELGISDVSGQSLAYKSLFAVGLLLFAMTFTLNLVSEWIKMRYREKYE